MSLHWLKKDEVRRYMRFFIPVRHYAMPTMQLVTGDDFVWYTQPAKHLLSQWRQAVTPDAPLEIDYQVNQLDITPAVAPEVATVFYQGMFVFKFLCIALPLLLLIIGAGFFGVSKMHDNIVNDIIGFYVNFTILYFLAFIFHKLRPHSGPDKNFLLLVLYNAMFISWLYLQLHMRIGLLANIICLFMLGIFAVYVYYLRDNHYRHLIFQRGTGMLQVKHESGEYYFPFVELDFAIVKFNGFFHLLVAHRYSEQYFFLQRSVKIRACYTFALFLTQYMDNLQPMPDIPALECYRQQDMVSKEYDEIVGRSDNYWQAMSWSEYLRLRRHRVEEIIAAGP